MPNDYTKQEVQGRVRRAMKSMFKSVAIVHASKNAVHVDFKGKNHLEVDVVPVTREHIQKEKRNNEAICLLRVAVFDEGMGEARALTPEKWKSIIWIGVGDSFSSEQSARISILLPSTGFDMENNLRI